MRSKFEDGIHVTVRDFGNDLQSDLITAGMTLNDIFRSIATFINGGNDGSSGSSISITQLETVEANASHVLISGGGVVDNSWGTLANIAGLLPVNKIADLDTTRALITNSTGKIEASPVSSGSLLNALNGYPSGPSVNTRLNALENIVTPAGFLELVTETSPNLEDDWLLWFDESAGRFEKVKIATLGLGGGTPPTPVGPLNVLRISNTFSYNTISATSLNGLFGDERGCIGLITNNSVSSASDRAEVYFYVKADYFWIGFPMDRRRFSTRTLTGTAYGTSTAQRRVKRTADSSDDSTIALVGNVDGRVYYHQEGDNDPTDDPDDGEFGIVDDFNLRVKDFNRTTSNLVRHVSSASQATQNITLLDTIPTITMSEGNESASALNTAFGSEEGSMGYNKNENELYFKINGYWWGLDLG